MKNIIKEVLNNLLYGNIDIIEKYRKKLNDIAIKLLDMNNISEKYKECLIDLIKICNITYNNMDKGLIPIDDGIYDLLCNKCDNLGYDIPVGSVYIDINNHDKIITSSPNNIEKSLISPIYYLNDAEKTKLNDMLFPDIINRNKRLTRDDFIVSPIMYDHGNIEKIKRDVSHEHPELVGTLDKCQYVLLSQAISNNRADKEPNVKIFERDWLYPTALPIFGENERFDIIATIKYDGVSVEADVTNEIISARTRGDTDQSLTSDITPILKGYRFLNCPTISEPFGMKFEAIMTYSNLEKYNQIRGYEYKNARTAIISLFRSLDAYLYKDLITLIPLQTSLKDDNGEPLDRLVEIEFINKYYCREELLRYDVLSGNYMSILFQVHKFTEEAQFSRFILPFMYDGVVFEYYDNDIRNKLGRKNSINKYSMAVKFETLEKQTIFRGYYFTIGQDGSITPMAEYDPIEFMGAVHTHSSISSYDRFMKLELRVGDIIDVEYKNDVMPYVKKSSNNHNIENSNIAPVPFIKYCPSCGSKLVLSNSGKTIYCLNMNCPERNIQRMVNTFDKLNISDFGEESIRKLGITSLKEFMECSVDDFAILGNTNKLNLYNSINKIKNEPIYDYKIIGSLGFTNCALKTWKIIFREIKLSELYNMYLIDKNEFIGVLSKIKGIGDITICTIVNEMDIFKDTIEYILNNLTILDSSSNNNQIKIRFTGFRNKDIVKELCDRGFDADDNSGVTKDTDILLLPHKDYNSGNKVKLAKKYGTVMILPVDDFINNIEYYTGGEI